MDRKRLTRRELQNLVTGIIDDAERDADAGLAVADVQDVEVSDAAWQERKRQVWS